MITFPAVEQLAERTVSRWVDAFNAQDLDGILGELDPQVDFHPLRLGGVAGSYRGHAGVRAWFAEMKRRHCGYQIALSDTRCVGDGKVFAVGALRLAGERDVGRFCALQRIERGLIVAVHHFLSDPDMIEYLGLIP